MAFYPIYIQATPGFGFQGGPEFSTNIKSLQSGREKRNGDWLEARHKYTAPFLNIDEATYRAIKDVFLACRGRLHTFLHRDWADYLAVNQPVGVGDGTKTTFQLTKTTDLGFGATYVREINKPVRDGAVVTVNGVALAAGGFSINETTGLLTLTSAPAVGADIRWSGEFDVQVRFDNDSLPWSLDNRSADGFATNGSVDLIEAIDE